MTSFEGSTLFSQINYHEKKESLSFWIGIQNFSSYRQSILTLWKCLHFHIFSKKMSSIENYKIMPKGFTKFNELGKIILWRYLTDMKSIC